MAPPGRLLLVDAGSPKSAIRACHEAGLLQSSQAEQALAIADDQNRTPHTYKEGRAEAIFTIVNMGVLSTASQRPRESPSVRSGQQPIDRPYRGTA
jgi:hypothetical protein